jgi:hypothetical protein
MELGVSFLSPPSQGSFPSNFSPLCLGELAGPGLSTEGRNGLSDLLAEMISHPRIIALTTGYGKHRLQPVGCP